MRMSAISSASEASECLATSSVTGSVFWTNSGMLPRQLHVAVAVEPRRPAGWHDRGGVVFLDDKRAGLRIAADRAAPDDAGLDRRIEAKADVPRGGRGIRAGIAAKNVGERRPA